MYIRNSGNLAVGSNLAYEHMIDYVTSHRSKPTFHMIGIKYPPFINLKTLKPKKNSFPLKFVLITFSIFLSYPSAVFYMVQLCIVPKTNQGQTDFFMIMSCSITVKFPLIKMTRHFLILFYYFHQPFEHTDLLGGMRMFMVSYKQHFVFHDSMGLQNSCKV